MEKINVAELLKDCPKGMELDCTVFEGVVFHDIVDRHFPIRVRREQGGLIELTANGCIEDKIDARCVIFPKGKTTWEGFQRPFKDGDILAYTSSYTTVFIYRNKGDEAKYATSFYVGHTIGVCYCNFHIYNKYSLTALNCDCNVRLATEEEKQKLFQAIKENGYKWNSETKTLEKLIEPKFKVGDKIKLKNHNYIYTITGIREKENKYECGVTFVLRFSEQDNWELVPNKFDINTLKPFESKVLVRGDENSYWKPAIFGCYIKDMKVPYYALGGTCWKHCIPYEGNEHLLSKKDNCDEYFKTWK